MVEPQEAPVARAQPYENAAGEQLRLAMCCFCGRTEFLAPATTELWCCGARQTLRLVQSLAEPASRDNP